MTDIIQGLSASPGIAIGPAWIYEPVEIIVKKVKNTNSDSERKRLQNALDQAKTQLEEVVEKARVQVGEDEADIFWAHILFLEDPELLSGIKSIIEKNINAEFAVQEGINEFADALRALDSEYFQARAADVLDVGRRIIACLMGLNLNNTELPQHPVVLFADDLNPSDTMNFQKEYILGLCTRKGGPTSHTAILSRSMGVPAVVSLPFEVKSIDSDQTVIIRGDLGSIVINPNDEEIEEAQLLQNQIGKSWERKLLKAKDPAITLDGIQVEIVANIGSEEDALQAIDYGAEGVGLLRTEFLYLNRQQFPEKQEEIDSYKKIFNAMGKLPVVVRTLDIGGDKQVSYLGLEDEPNPFLGWRAIRMTSENPEILKDQFQALLQAGVNTDLRIMLPLVSSIDEVILGKNILEDAKEELKRQGIPFANKIQYGIMIEVPSAALLVEQFADYVDFFSIGTNDLAQYTIAVDRTNERVASLASPFHPAVLKLIKMSIEGAHSKGKWIGLCGEMAGNPLAIPLLLGMGLDEFSMSSVAIPEAKEIIRGLDKEKCEIIAEGALSMATTDEVIFFLQAQE